MKVTSKLKHMLVLSVGKNVVKIAPGENEVDPRFWGALSMRPMIQKAMKDKLMTVAKASPIRLTGKAPVAVAKAAPVVSKVEVASK